MTTAELEKRVRTLEREVKHLHQVVATRSAASPGIPKKKMPAGLRQALKEIKEGKLIGPFYSAKEFMTDLGKK